MSAWGMLKEGKVGDAIVRIVETILGIHVPKPVADLIAKTSTDEGKILWNAAAAFLSDADARGLKQASVDGWETIRHQVPSMALSDLEDFIGLQMRARAS